MVLGAGDQNPDRAVLHGDLPGAGRLPSVPLANVLGGGAPAAFRGRAV